jgi:hypothetical protein
VWSAVVRYLETPPPPSRGFYQKGFHPMTTDTMPADVIELMILRVHVDVPLAGGKLLRLLGGSVASPFTGA